MSVNLLTDRYNNMSNRKIVEKEILHFIDLFRPGSNNVDIYKDLFSKMSDTEFDKWMEDLANGESLVLYSPLAEKPALNITTNIDIAAKLGVQLTQHIYLTDSKTGQTRKTPNRYFVGEAVVRRQAQTLANKNSIPSASVGSVDERTGQAGASTKGARMSGPELHVNASKGLDKMLIELIKYRGGDERGYNLFKQSLHQTGEVSIDYLLSNYDTTVKSNKTLSVYLKAMLLQNELV